VSYPSGAGGGRARLHWGWTLGLTGLLLAGAAAAALHSPWLKLRDIEVAGAEQADVAGRLERAGIGPGAFMIWLRPGQIEAAVRADPWVAEVRVQRVFPGRLVVEVLEHRPALWAASGEGWLLVARRGVVVEAAAEPGAGLLQVQVPYPAAAPGEELTPPEWRELVDLALALSPGLAARSRVTSEGGELWIAAEGFRARLGPPVDLADKGRVFEALLAEGLAVGAQIDLVAPTRPAVFLPGAGVEEEDQPVVEG